MRKRQLFWTTTSVAVAVALLGSAAGARAASTYNFDSTAVGTSTPLLLTNNGVTASFSSPVDPGGFAVTPTFFSTLTGNVLLAPGPAGANNIPLTIAFSQSLSSISLSFALNTLATTTPLTLSALLGSTPVGSGSATGTIPPTFVFPEGTLSFSGATFNSVVLSTTAPSFGVDNIVVNPATNAVPEPSALRMAGEAGMLCLIAVGYHRRGRGTRM